MSVTYSHRGCATPMWKFLPDGRPHQGMLLRREEWQSLCGDSSKGGDQIIPTPCPDCGRDVFVGPQYLSEIVS